MKRRENFRTWYQEMITTANESCGRTCADAKVVFTSGSHSVEVADAISVHWTCKQTLVTSRVRTLHVSRILEPEPKCHQLCALRGWTALTAVVRCVKDQSGGVCVKLRAWPERVTGRCECVALATAGPAWWESLASCYVNARNNKLCRLLERAELGAPNFETAFVEKCFESWEAWKSRSTSKFIHKFLWLVLLPFLLINNALLEFVSNMTSQNTNKRDWSHFKIGIAFFEIFFNVGLWSSVCCLFVVKRVVQVIAAAVLRFAHAGML